VAFNDPDCYHTHVSTDYFLILICQTPLTGRCIVNNSPVTKPSLETTDEVEEEAHEERAQNQHWTTTPLVNVDNGGDGSSDIENVLDGLSVDQGGKGDVSGGNDFYYGS